MDELIQSITKSYGLIGVFMISPMVATVYLWADNKRLNKKLIDQAISFSQRVEEIGGRVVDAQTQRVKDAQSITDKMVGILVENTSHTKELYISVDRLGDLLSQALVSMHAPSNVAALRARKSSQDGG
jgi:hypothetical protein